MNHIHRMQNEIVQLNGDILTRAERIQDFRNHLASPKFNPVQADGTRGDWIAVADVQRWLRYIEDTAQFDL
jgi:hypothetical protein